MQARALQIGRRPALELVAGDRIDHLLRDAVCDLTSEPGELPPLRQRDRVPVGHVVQARHAGPATGPARVRGGYVSQAGTSSKRASSDDTTDENTSDASMY